MNLWKKLFGVESPKVGIAQGKSPGPPAITSDQSVSFHEALRKDDLEKVKTLLKKNPGLANTDGEFSEKPLNLAAARGHKELAALLLANQAEVNAKGGLGGYTALHQAARNGRKEVVELLLASGAEVNAKDKDGDTPLHLAAAHGHKEVAELLLANKADVNAEGWYGYAPLHVAALNNRKDMVQLLLASKAEVDARDKHGTMPVRLAEGKGYDDIAELLRHASGTRPPSRFAAPPMPAGICYACGGSGRQRSGGGGYQACRWCHGRGRK